MIPAEAAPIDEEWCRACVLPVNGELYAGDSATRPLSEFLGKDPKSAFLLDGNVDNSVDGR